MKKFLIKRTSKKGWGVFAVCDIRKGEHIIKHNLTKSKSYSTEEVAKHPQHRSDHWDEVGGGGFVLDYSPHSYINHSCDPNCFTKYCTLKKKDIVALRDIKSGEELTVDYSTGSIYGFGKKSNITTGYSIMVCACGS